MFVIAGLGNPGSEYTYTRHNIGFRALDAIASSSGSISVNWQEKPSYHSTKVRIAGEQCLLVKPMLFMNLSGEALQPVLKFFKVPVDNLIVIHDELDLAPGVLKVKKGGGAAGNNGLKDIIRHLDADFTRIRLGIGHPRDEIDDGNLDEDGKKRKRGGKNQNVSSWVLGEAGSNEQELLDKAVQLSGDAVKMLIEDGLKPTQKFFNQQR